MWEQVAEGTMADLKDASTYEDRVQEGTRGRLQLTCRMPVPVTAATTLQGALDIQRVAGAKVSVSSNTLSVVYRKGFPWLAVIVAAILGIIVLAVLIVSWMFFRELAAAGVPPWLIVSGAILGMLLIGYIVYKVR